MAGPIKETAVESALRTLKTPWIPGILLAAVMAAVALNQMGYISLPHFGNANSAFDAWEFPEGAVIGTPWSYDFSHQLTPLLDPEGSNGPYTFYLGSGTGFPPMGLILSPDGVLSGTPTGTGGNFQVCVKDVGGRSKCRTYHLTVASASATSGGQNGNVGQGGRLSGRWEGTYTVRDVLGACIDDTTAKISICIAQKGQNFTGVVNFPSGFKDAITKTDPSEICVPIPHCGGGGSGDSCSQINGYLSSSGGLNIDFLTLDGIGYFYGSYYESENGQASATITGGNSMTVQFSKAVSASTTTGSFTATKVSDNC